MTPVVVCQHNQIAEQCLRCTFTTLSDHLDALYTAVTAARGSAVRSTYVTGGTPSWEPLNLGAMALLQDIVSDGRRLLLGRRNEDLSAGSVLWLLERQVDRLGQEDPVSQQVRSKVTSWAQRAAAILDLAKAPWPLTIDRVLDNDGQRRHTTVHVSCPVVDPKVERPCSGKLFVHQADDLRSAWGESASITCSRDKTHSWSKARGGWVRLQVLLGDVSKVA